MKKIIAAISIAVIGSLACPVFLTAAEEKEETVKMSDLPAAVQTTIKDKAGSNEIMKVEKKTEDGKTVYEPDASSTEVYWARFYDLKTAKPVFPGRDGVLYDTYEAMAANNHVGYDYYSTQPGSIPSRVRLRKIERLNTMSTIGSSTVPSCVT